MTPAPDFVSTLQQLADLAEIRGPAGLAAGLRREVEAIAALDPRARDRLLRRARRDRLDDRDVNPTIRWKLREIALGGGEVAVRAALAGIPSLLRRLVELPALSTGQGARLVRQLGIVTLADLEVALDDGRLAQVLPQDVARLASAVAALRTEAPGIPLGRALEILADLASELHGRVAGLTQLEAAGDARRYEPVVREIVLVAAAVDPPAAVEAICHGPTVSDVLHRSSRRAIVHFRQVEVDVRVAAPDEFGTALFVATGSREHVAAVTALRGRPPLQLREEDVYRHAGLAFIPPELRQASGEIESAAQGRLPPLVDRVDIRGDLHMHTTYSDGRDTLADMAAACASLGYEYIGIADHSWRAAASRTLSIDDVARQREEIEGLRVRYPAMGILHGVEVDVMLDGSLDFPDDVLEGFDIVIASMHESGHQDPATLTRRCLQAIRHPLVNVIAHPANRFPGRTPGYALDFDAVYAAAAETGTALEVDGGPAHLDLDGERAHAAVGAGVTLTIDSDCHRARALSRHMQMAVGTARRGWVEARHVLNTRPIEEVRAFLAAKRHA